MSSPRAPIDWGRAEKVANQIAARRPAPEGALPSWHPPIEQIEQQIELVTGLRSANGIATATLIDRREWIHANIESFRHLLAPVFERWAESRPGGVSPGSSMGSSKGATAVSRQVAGVQLGALLGWMGTRVLGQYDLLVGRDASDDGAVYLVAPNLAAVERRFGFEPDEFRTWVLVHELTHRAQFTGVPWMREYFTGLVDQSLAIATPDPAELLASLKESLRDRGSAGRQLRDSGLAGLIAGPEQRAVLARVGGLMSLLEGHGDVTMTRAAGGLVPNADRFARVLAERRTRGNPITRLLMRLTGMEGKLNQYAAGERFIAAAEAQGGPRVVDVCWVEQGNLPSLDEIRDPPRWLERVGVGVA